MDYFVNLPIVKDIHSSYVGQSVKAGFKNIKNGLDDWFPHVTSAGIISSIACIVFSLPTAGCIGGSAFITGGVAFAAYQIGFTVTEMSDEKKMALGAATCLVFSYAASIPLITAVVFVILGMGGKVIVSSYPYIEKKIFSLFSSGMVGGLIYAGLLQVSSWVVPPPLGVPSPIWNGSVTMGIGNMLWSLLIVRAATSYIIDEKCLEKDILDLVLGTAWKSLTSPYSFMTNFAVSVISYGVYRIYNP